LLQEKLVEVRSKNEERQMVVDEAGIKLSRSIRENRCERVRLIDRRNTDQEIPNLSERAKAAEDCVAAAMMLAEASIDDAELMILEAIAAGRDAESVTSD
jgi:tellurite resistance protein